MKEESDKHRLWVQEHQRQVIQLQKQLRKDTVQIGMQKIVTDLHRVDIQAASCLGRMTNKLQQQDLVMKAKTERAMILQRELTVAKRRMVNSKSKPRVHQPQPVSASMKDSIRRIIGTAVQSRFCHGARSLPSDE